MFIRTDRLLLRPGWIQDAPALFAAIADRDIVRNLASPPWPYRLADAEAFLSAERRPQEPSLLIFRRAGGAPELAGTIGIGRKPDGDAELGYWIARPFWGRGYATEAGCAILASARESLRLRRLVAGHFLDNPASGRVLAKLGFRRTGAVAQRFSAGRGEMAPCRLFELDLALEAGTAEAAPVEAMAA